MKQKLLLILVFVVLIVALIGLNAAGVNQKPKMPDSEFSPNRSTYNAGATGMQAFYALLAETGRKVVRWQEPPDALSRSTKNTPGTFVVIGPLRREFTEPETAKLLSWVSDGGKLVVIDREPPDELLVTTTDWKLSVKPDFEGIFTVDPSDAKTMTGGVAAAKPSNPSLLTAGVGSIQVSKFASGFGFERNKTKADKHALEFAAPVVHIRSEDKNVLVDMPYGAGRIVCLTDPFILSNSGISLVDNAQLAVNLASAGDRPIAIDEYHHGYGANNNRLAQYFAGTPVIAIFIQGALLVGLLFYSRSRRFARALPVVQPDRLTKLEYIAAMAELQQRTRAYDLAVENVYREFRSRVARFLGVDNRTTSRTQLASLIAERTRIDRDEIDGILFKAEEIMHGEPTNKAEVTRVVASIRDLERALNLRRRPTK